MNELKDLLKGFPKAGYCDNYTENVAIWLVKLQKTLAGKVLVDPSESAIVNRKTLETHWNEMPSLYICEHEVFGIEEMTEWLARLAEILEEGKFAYEDSLSPQEIKDVEIAEKEFASGKTKTFKNIDDLLTDLHSSRIKGRKVKFAGDKK